MKDESWMRRPPQVPDGYTGFSIERYTSPEQFKGPCILFWNAKDAGKKLAEQWAKGHGGNWLTAYPADDIKESITSLNFPVWVLALETETSNEWGEVAP